MENDQQKELFTGSEKHFESYFGNIIVKDYTTPLHSDIICEIIFALKSKAKQENKRWRVFSNTVALWCEKINHQYKGTYFLPDIMVVCEPKENDIKIDGVYTVPDFVCEVSSASSREFDLNKKRQVYKGLGVKEYWVIDPEKQYVAIHAIDDLEGSYNAHWEKLDKPVKIMTYDVEIDLCQFCGDK